ISREGLYRALSPEGNPEFTTVMKVIHALGVRLHADPVR
ncbi:MAG: transcriptional regulator, partial [Candidatus Competibacteraceae bacterium]